MSLGLWESKWGSVGGYGGITLGRLLTLKKAKKRDRFPVEFEETGSSNQTTVSSSGDKGIGKSHSDGGGG